MSAMMRWCVCWTFLGLFLLPIVVLALGVTGATVPDGSVKLEKKINLRQHCGLRTCDLRTHYCDEVIGDCALCADDCHPARIEGDARATEDCHRICQWYYRFQRVQHSERGIFRTQGSSDDEATNDDGDGDDQRQVGQMSRAELRMLIEMELLKVQTSSCLEKGSVVVVCFCLLLLVARWWFCTSSNLGQRKPRSAVNEDF